MKTLRILQQQFITHISSPSLDVNTEKADKTSSEQRFAIYRNNTIGRIINALEITYPVCKLLVGDDFFKRMAVQFIEEVPPNNCHLIEYGGTFADFITTYLPVKELLYLPDMASLEWFLHQIYYGPALIKLSSADLAHVNSEARFCLAGEIKLLDSSFNLLKLWEIHQHAIGEADHFELLDEKEYLVIWREAGHGPQIMAVTESERLILQIVKTSPCSLDELCQQLPASVDLTYSLPYLLQAAWLQIVK